MVFKDILNATKLRTENEKLQTLITPELKEIEQQQCKINELNITINRLNKEISEKKQLLNQLQKNIDEKGDLIVELDEKILYQNFGLYTPRFSFTSSEIYKQKLIDIRNKEKNLIKNNLAVTGDMSWTVNGNARIGQKMVKDMQKLLLRAFNSECDDAIDHVKYGNYEQSTKKINHSAESISRLGSIMNVSITQDYYNLKMDELSLALEYQIKKQEEKEELRAAREEQKEAAKLLKEIEEQRMKVEKEHKHYKTAYAQLLSKLQLEPNNQYLLNKKSELEYQLNEIDKTIENLDYREANQRAGYVYIISNIGAFGENVYKIGMTRRLNPQERIDELGDASVPFKFDVHAMIFSDDAPSLETALHKAFENKKVNMINHRREFFNVSLDEIKEVIRTNYDKTVDYVDIPEATQYRQSIELKQHQSYI